MVRLNFGDRLPTDLDDTKPSPAVQADSLSGEQERVVVTQPGAVFAPQEINVAAKAAVQALEAGSKDETVNKPAQAGTKH